MRARLRRPLREHKRQVPAHPEIRPRREREHNRAAFRKKATPEKRHRRHFAPVDPASRLKFAIAKAREMKAILRRGDADDLANATLLQVIISGDVISASIVTRQRLQRENLRLRERLAVQKLRESRAQERLLHITAEKAEHQMSREEMQDTIREIYGLEQLPRTYARPALPAAIEVTAENPAPPEPQENPEKSSPTCPQDAPVASS